MKKRVIVVGGGVAGLSAAWELLKHGCAVTVLEAKPVFGGRVRTLSEQGMPIELGAEFLHGQSAALHDFIRAAGLRTQPVLEQHRIFEQGRLRQVNLWGRMRTLLGQVDVRQPDCSAREFFESHRFPSRSRKLATGFVQGFHAAHLARISAHALRRGDYTAEHMENTQQRRLTKGYGALVSHFEQTIRSQGGVLSGSTHARVIRWRRGIDLSATSEGKAAVLSADAAIVTLPLGVLKAGTVKFDPPLTAKRDAIAGLELGHVLRRVFVFRERWWREKDFGFVHAFDSAMPTWWSDPRGAMVTGWAGGPKAEALRDRSAVEIEALGLRTLARIFARKPSALRAGLLSVYGHDWTLDPHLRGAYSYIPVNGLDLPKLLAAPLEGTLFFAGEAAVTDAQTGTVSAAFDSGLRAAREVLAS